MKKAMLFLLAVALICGFPSLVAAQEQPAGSPTQAQQGALSEEEKDFMTEAAEGNLFEVKAGKLAQETATSEAVKRFGQRMATDHAKANEGLESLAKAKYVQLPKQIAQEKQRMYDELANASKENFDKTYMDMMVKDHEEDVATFQKQLAEAKDADLKAWVTKTLPTLQSHLDEAKQIENELKSSQMK
jgi:putative membrane protein